MAHMYSVLYSIRSNLIQPASAISHFLFLWKISFMWTKHILLNFKKSHLCDVMFANIYFFIFFLHSAQESARKVSCWLEQWPQP